MLYIVMYMTKLFYNKNMLTISLKIILCRFGNTVNKIVNNVYVVNVATLIRVSTNILFYF